MIAASVALTALFAEAAAHAFPGKSTARATSRDGHSSTRSRRGAGSAGKGSSDKTTRSLRPPAEAPQATSATPHPAESSTSGRAAPTEEPAPPAEAAPAEEAAREPEPQGTYESAPVQESPPPVVSGGS